MSTAGWCIVPGCPSCSHEVYHHFPKDQVASNSWLKLVKSPTSRKPILFGHSSRVCSLHFTDDDYGEIQDGDLILQPLKSTAIPSIFPWTGSWPFNKKVATVLFFH